MIHPHSQIWTPDVIRDIHVRAQGQYQLSGFRPLKDIPTFDELVFLAAGLTRFPLEGYKEKCKTETVLGARFSSTPLRIETPIYVHIWPDLETAVRIGLAKGSALAHSALSTSGKMSAEERKACQRVIYELPAERTTLRAVSAIAADAIQFNVLRPTPTEVVAELIKRARKERESKVPIFVRLAAGRVEDAVRAVVRARADGIVLEGLNTTRIGAPDALTNYFRLPTIAAIPRAREALRESKVLGEVSLMVMTAIRNGADAAKALALGADAVSIDDSALVAAGYYTASEQILAGTASEASRKRKVNYDKAGERVAKFINSITMEMALLARSLGKGDVHSLEYEDLSALTFEASAMSGVKMAGE
jgi:dihydroorotate dehydrogenase